MRRCFLSDINFARCVISHFACGDAAVMQSEAQAVHWAASKGRQDKAPPRAQPLYQIKADATTRRRARMTAYPLAAQRCVAVSACLWVID
jgi:hypothetical protein